MTLDNHNRIAKEIARRGYCSRRQAEVLIQEGKVTTKGIAILDPSTKVLEDTAIEISGIPLKVKDKTRLWRLYKPVGYLTTRQDPQGRKTIFDLFPQGLPAHLIPIGRLDYNSQGLLLLTNDGGLAKEMMHPKNHIPRTYEVDVFGTLLQKDLQKIEQGMTVDGINYGSIKVKVLKKTAHNATLLMTLTEGKNREIRNIANALDLKVKKLKRLSFGPYELGSLQKGAIQEVPFKTQGSAKKF